VKSAPQWSRLPAGFKWAVYFQENPLDEKNKLMMETGCDTLKKFIPEGIGYLKK
jgi:hypothetical protein